MHLTPFFLQEHRRLLQSFLQSPHLFECSLPKTSTPHLSPRIVAAFEIFSFKLPALKLYGILNNFRFASGPFLLVEFTNSLHNMQRFLNGKLTLDLLFIRSFRDEAGRLLILCLSFSEALT